MFGTMTSYRSFKEGNVIVIAVKDESLFTPEKLSAWNALSKN